jgi:hypothetical protein
MCTSNLKDKNDRPPAALAGSAAAASRHYNVAISSLISSLKKHANPTGGPLIGAAQLGYSDRSMTKTNNQTNAAGNPHVQLKRCTPRFRVDFAG